MRRVKIQATTADWTATEAFNALVDLEDYPRHTPDVHHVHVIHSEGRQTSEWEVAFGNGILRWVEEDHVDEKNRCLHFRLLTGDIASFSGSWRVEPISAGCRVTFDAEFDLDIPGLTDVLEPVAAKALGTSVRSILRGLLDPATAVTEDHLRPSAAAL